MTAMKASAMKTYEVYMGAFCLLIGSHQERQLLHTHDAHAAARGERGVAVVAHGPVAAAVFRLATIAGRERDRQGDEAPLRGPGMDRGRDAPEAAVDTA